MQGIKKVGNTIDVNYSISLYTIIKKVVAVINNNKQIKQW